MKTKRLALMAGVAVAAAVMVAPSAAQADSRRGPTIVHAPTNVYVAADRCAPRHTPSWSYYGQSWHRPVYQPPTYYYYHRPVYSRPVYVPAPRYHSYHYVPSRSGLNFSFNFDF
jgi:hypothetical protein